MSGDSCKNAPTDLEFQKCEINRSLNLLHSPTLDIWPDKKFDPARIPGILVTWLLVSLGAPFWYDLLKNLFQMRSVLADRSARARRARHTSAVNGRRDKTGRCQAKWEYREHRVGDCARSSRGE